MPEHEYLTTSQVLGLLQIGRTKLWELVRDGAELILNPSASPWHVGKAHDRRDMLARLALTHRVPVVFVNQVGGNDENHGVGLARRR